MTKPWIRLRGRTASAIFFLSFVLEIQKLCQAFPTPQVAFTTGKTTSPSREAPTRLLAVRDNERRRVLSRIALSPLVTFPKSAAADEAQDMTSKLFNPDGSLKEGMVDEAKSRTVETSWPQSDGTILLNVDGVNTQEIPSSGQKVRITYVVPEKWEQGDRLYLDKSEGVNRKACNRITVYQAPGIFSVDRLEKATDIGVARALDAPDSMKALQYGDVIGGRKQKKDGQTYFEFDMAVAPESCASSSQKNLGLGFCPYDTIFLLSATVLEGHLYVITVECDDDEWKQASSDLKRVRSSFNVALL